MDCPLEDELFLKWKEEGRLISICPEVFGGLPTPRPDSQRIGDKVIACTGEDVTAEYELGAREALRLAIEHDVVCCMMKQDTIPPKDTRKWSDRVPVLRGAYKIMWQQVYI